MSDNQKYLDTSGMKLLRWLREAQAIQPEPIGDHSVTESPGAPPPRFPTSLEGWNEKTAGGGYGLTCIAGYPKCGKSMLALGCAIEAARDDVPWRVLYFDAELSRYEILTRIRRYLGTEPTKELVEHFSVHPTELGASIPEVFHKVAEKIDLEDENLLIVLDSLQRIVELSLYGDGDNAYWNTMRSWVNLCRMASKLSGGRVASIVVSELALKGHVKGNQIEHAADLVLKIKADEDAEYFDLFIPHARSSAGGPLGKHWLDAKRGRFIHVDGS